MLANLGMGVGVSRNPQAATKSQIDDAQSIIAEVAQLQQKTAQKYPRQGPGSA
jgi:hypothetical protein